MNLNALTCTDSYKLGHAAMYADGTTKVYSNLTPRSDKIYRRNCTQFYDGKVVVLGVQGAVQEIKEMWDKSFFSQPKEKVLAKYKARLDSHIGLIYGDSITTKRAEEILRRLADKGFASGNVVFGVGSYTYQCNTRDTFGFAVKATYTEVNGEGIAIFKDPKTDSKKKSAKGLLFVDSKDIEGKEELFLVDNVAKEAESCVSNMLQTIFIDGQFVKRTSLEEIRSRLV